MTLSHTSQRVSVLSQGGSHLKCPHFEHGHHTWHTPQETRVPLRVGRANGESRKEEKMLKRQLKPPTKFSQQVLQWILNVFGTVYVLIERLVEYPDDDIILGMDIDEDLQTMSRKNLCRYMDAVLPQRGFFDIQSTSKIRLGCQLLREFKQLKKDK